MMNYSGLIAHVAGLHIAKVTDFIAGSAFMGEGLFRIYK